MGNRQEIKEVVVKLDPKTHSMRDFLALAKADYLTSLFVAYDGNRSKVAEHLECSPQNLTKMLGGLKARFEP